MDYGYVKDETSDKTLKDLMTTDKGFIPIGIVKDSDNNDTRLSKTFQGTFDGKNNYLSNVYINSDSYAGIFGMIQAENITIKNVGIKDGSITGTTIKPIGGIVGLMNFYGKIENCYNYADIKNSADGGLVGGILGNANITSGNTSTSASINNCYNGGAVEGKSCTGGIVGVGYNVTNSYNKGNITGSGPTGGIIGSGSNAINCYNTGIIIGSGAPTGGIIGSGNNPLNCYNTGNVESDNLTGGIVGGTGGNSYEIVNCYNLGKIKGKGQNPVGGICGGGSNATNCYNFEIVEGQSCVGGIFGSGGNINNCYNVNDLTNKGTSAPTGGITGNGTNITNSYNTGKIIATKLMGEIIGMGTVSKDCWYLTRTTEEGGNASANGAEGKDKKTMDEAVSVEKYITTLNTEVSKQNETSEIKWKEWKLQNGYPVFK